MPLGVGSSLYRRLKNGHYQLERSEKIVGQFNIK